MWRELGLWTGPPVPAPVAQPRERMDSAVAAPSVAFSAGAPHPGYRLVAVESMAVKASAEHVSRARLNFQSVRSEAEECAVEVRVGTRGRACGALTRGRHRCLRGGSKSAWPTCLDWRKQICEWGRNVCGCRQSTQLHGVFAGTRRC